MRLRVVTQDTELHGNCNSNLLDTDRQESSSRAEQKCLSGKPNCAVDRHNCFRERRLSASSMGMSSIGGSRWSSTRSHRGACNNETYSDFKARPNDVAIDQQSFSSKGSVLNYNKSVDSYVSTSHGDVGVRLANNDFHDIDPVSQTKSNRFRRFFRDKHKKKMNPNRRNKTANDSGCLSAQTNVLNDNVAENFRADNEDGYNTYEGSCEARSPEPNVPVVVDIANPEVGELVPLRELSYGVPKKSRWSSSSKHKKMDNSRYD